MVHTLIGNIGHFLTLLAFTSALAALWAYVASARASQAELSQSWIRYAHSAFVVHTLAVVGIVVTLFLIIYNHYYEYHYAWEHSSNNLPVYYMISCFWEGQEGSFLLWIFWNVLLGLVLIKVAGIWKAPVMSVVVLVQVFLSSMILGVVIAGEFKIGSSPFLLLREFMADAPVFQNNPDYIPEDGTGLNPLLQNYWMVIHPPTLFMGFAASVVPFAFCIAGLWKRKYSEWVRPALPWALFAAAVLGLGILMGAYWAYETLNFGGYWNWDPVENAVYVPWIVMVASIHTMILYKNSGRALKTSVVLVSAAFILVLYSTFLTRSGILGDASVHSFTDLGLSGQLFWYLIVFVILAVALAARRWKHMPVDDKEMSAYSGEFWIFMGITLLSLASFQVLVMTSVPVYNKLLGFVGIGSKLAPPADPIMFYTQWQMWFAIGVAFVSATAQFFYWKKLDGKKFLNAVYLPGIVSLLLTAMLIVLTKVDNFSYIVLLLACVYAVSANVSMAYMLWKNSKKPLYGGSVTHIGFALMLAGIMYSSGYSEVVSINYSGLLYSKEFPDDVNRENVLLFMNEPQKMSGYTLNYKRVCLESRDVKGYIDRSNIEFIAADRSKALVVKEIENQTAVKPGDTIQVYGENTYFEVEFANESDTFTLYPRAQVNPGMGLIASPDIKHYWFSDLYTHVSSIPDTKEDKEWSPDETHTISIGDTFFVNDYVAMLQKIERVPEVPGVALSSEDAAVRAQIAILGERKEYIAEPYFVIKDKAVGLLPDIKPELGLKIALTEIDPVNHRFTFVVNTTQKEWIILKAVRKPYINLLWIGTVMMVLGMSIAARRRYAEFKNTDGR